MKKILFVDLDMSLIKTDIMREQLVREFVRYPWKTLKILFSQKFKPERVKDKIVRKVEVDPETLPYNHDVLAYVKKAKDDGRKVVLATATHEFIAKKIASYIGYFDDVLATDGTFNCKGINKLDVMKKYAGDAPFDYVGDSHADKKIFKETDTPIIVGNMSYTGAHERIETPGFLKPFIKSMRPHQWAKNLLIFFPLFVSHTFSAPSFMIAMLGFVCFSMSASAVYIINDIVDVEDDRHHISNKSRPFASGDLSLDAGLTLCLLLLSVSFMLTTVFLPEGVIVLSLYVVLSLLYSFSLKTQPILDVFCLSALYAIRVIYGQEINHIDPSPWLLAFCIFFFLSLAFMKRAIEIYKTEQNEQRLSPRRGYEVEDGLLIRVAGISSGLLSILVLALYTNSYNVVKLYQNPDFLWGAVYVLLYWKIALWLVVLRGRMDQDPVLFALKDKGSYMVGFLVIIFVLMAKGISL